METTSTTQTTAVSSSSSQQQQEQVQRHYANYILEQKGGVDDDNEIVYNERVVCKLGYDENFLSKIISGKNNDITSMNDNIKKLLFQASCGSGCPLRLDGAPKIGETCIDFGCGAGHDIILASYMVGNSGCVIGIDITKEMLYAAQNNINTFCNNNNNNNDHNDNNNTTAPIIQLIQYSIDDQTLLLENNQLLHKEIANVIISNGVFNLCTNKRNAFINVYKLLKPGGRLLFSDVCRINDNENNNNESIIKPIEMTTTVSEDDGWSN